MDFDDFWANIDWDVFLVGALHFKPQSWFIQHDWVRTLRFEHLQEDFDQLFIDTGREPYKLPVYNASVGMIPDMTPTFIETVNRVYAADFERFGFKMLDPKQFEKTQG